MASVCLSAAPIHLRLYFGIQFDSGLDYNSWHSIRRPHFHNLRISRSFGNPRHRWRHLHHRCRQRRHTPPSKCINKKQNKKKQINTELCVLILNLFANIMIWEREKKHEKWNGEDESSTFYMVAYVFLARWMFVGFPLATTNRTISTICPYGCKQRKKEGTRISESEWNIKRMRLNQQAWWMRSVT